MSKSTRPNHLKRLDAVLKRYGLKVADVPGIEDAWSEQFAITDQPQPKTTEEYLSDLLGNPNWGRHRGGPSLVIEDPDQDAEDYESVYSSNDVTDDQTLVISVYTRNGSGNREHYHDEDEIAEDGKLAYVEGCTACATDRLQQHPLYLFDEDGSFDGTYATFYFKLPAKNRQAALETLDHRDHAAAWHKATSALANIEAGETAPWIVLATEEDAQALAQHVRTLEKDKLGDYPRVAISREYTSVQLALDVLTTGTIPEGHSPRDQIIFHDEKTPYQRYLMLQKVQEIATTHREAQERSDRLSTIRAEVEANGSETLKSYLFDKLAERTYSVNEGTGRRKRLVTRKYQPNSAFLQDEEDAKRDLRRATETYDELHTALTKVIEYSKNKLSRDIEATRELASDELKARHWGLGWTGKGDVPAPPATSKRPA